MADQIFDKRTVGIPSDIELNRIETKKLVQQAEQAAQRAENLRDETNTIAQQATSQTAASALAASESAKEAKDAAEQAAASLADGKGFTFSPQEQKDKKDGHVWFRVAGREIKGLYPGTTTFPGKGVYPTPHRTVADGTDTIDAIRQWEQQPGAAGSWHDYKFAPSLTTTK